MTVVLFTSDVVTPPAPPAPPEVKAIAAERLFSPFRVGNGRVRIAGTILDDTSLDSVDWRVITDFPDPAWTTGYTHTSGEGTEEFQFWVNPPFVQGQTYRLQVRSSAQDPRPEPARIALVDDFTRNNEDPAQGWGKVTPTTGNSKVDTQRLKATTNAWTVKEPFFPATPVLDDFTRADGSLGSNWTGLSSGSTVNLTISGNKVMPTAQYGTGAFTGVTPFSTNCEAYATNANSFAVSAEMYVYLITSDTVGTGSYAGYAASLRHDGYMTVAKYTAGSLTALDGVMGTAPSTGTILGVRYINNKVQLWRKDPGGSWYRPLEYADTTHNAKQFYPAVYIDGQVALGQGFDNLGGGSLTSDVVYGPDVALVLQMVTRPSTGNGLELYSRLEGVGTVGAEGIAASFYSNNATETEVTITINVGGSYTDIDSVTTTAINSGDYVGFSAVGNLFTAWHLPLGGDEWVPMISVTDTTYTVAGPVGVNIPDSTTVVDNFYVGTLSSDPITETVIDETFEWVWTVRDLMPRFTDLYMPSWIQESDVALSLNTLFARTIEDMYTWLEDAGFQAIPHLATWTMPLWEEILDIAVSPSTSWIERRNLATVKRSVVYPDDLRTEFFDVIRRLTGVLPSSIIEDYPNYRLDLVTAAESGSRLARDLDRVIQERKPVGIQVNNNVTGFLADFGRADLDTV